MNNSQITSQSVTAGVVCTAARDPSIRLFILAAMFIGFGLWCLTDLRTPPEAWDLKHINEAAAYLMNNWGPVALFPAGLVAVVWAVVFLRRKLVADTEGIGYAGKQKILWSEIKSLDASQLRQKGILYLRYGEDKILVLDSWKLNNFRELVAFVEQHVK